MATALELAKSRVNIFTVGKMFLPGWKPGYPCSCPDREDNHPSFAVSNDGQRFYDFSSGEKGDVAEFLARIRRIPNPLACSQLIQLAGVSRGESDPLPPVAPAPAATGTQRPRQKPRLPIFDEGTFAEHRALAKLRNLAPEAIETAIGRGVLRFGYWKGSRVWVITDRDCWAAQVRRLDGAPWQQLSDSKAWTLPGSRASWPCGFHDAVRRKRVALVEGGPDLLAGFHFGLLSGSECDLGVIAMLGAHCRIPQECLGFFRGMPVRIFMHDDEPGLKAVRRWAAQLIGAGARVSGFSFAGLIRTDGGRVEDIFDMASVSPECFED
jgi:hypothetical protein